RKWSKAGSFGMSYPLITEKAGSHRPFPLFVHVRDGCGFEWSVRLPSDHYPENQSANEGKRGTDHQGVDRSCKSHWGFLLCGLPQDSRREMASGKRILYCDATH